MIHEVSGDILLTKAQAIAHGVATNDNFQEGLRSALRGKWPTVGRGLPALCRPMPSEAGRYVGMERFRNLDC